MLHQISKKQGLKMIQTLHYLIFPKSFFNSKAGKAKLAYWSTRVRKKANHTCKKCGSTKQTEAHHIYPKSIYPKLAFQINNGICLCKQCHRIAENSIHSSYPLKKLGAMELMEWLNKT